MTRRLPPLFAALLLAASCLCFDPALAQEANQEQWPETASELHEQADQVRAEAQAAGQDMAQDQAALEKRTAALRAASADKEARLDVLRERFEALIERERQARAELADREQDLALIESAALNTARDTERLYFSSLAAVLAQGQAEDRMAACRELLDSEGMPTFEQISGLVRGLFAEIRETGRVAVTQAPFLGPTGDEVDGRVLRLGNNVAYYQLDSDVGPLVVLEGGRLSAGGADLPGQAEQAALTLFNGSGNALPADLSGGAALRAGSRGGFWDHIRSGGVLIWPILGVGLAGLLIGLERLWVLLRVKQSSSSMLDRLAELMGQGRRDECRQVCSEAGDSPACRVLEASLDHAGASKEVLENVFHDAILREVPRLERFLPTLSVLGAVAPLLGLLGTVTGMINTFTVMTLAGNSDPKLMSGGISQALVTTELGLAVAIPILLVHHFLERRVNSIVSDMEEKSVAFSVTLLDNGTKGGRT